MIHVGHVWNYVGQVWAHVGGWGVWSGLGLCSAGVGPFGERKGPLGLALPHNYAGDRAHSGLPTVTGC